jgi:hypothetical protein
MRVAGFYEKASGAHFYICAKVQQGRRCASRMAAKEKAACAISLQCDGC